MTEAFASVAPAQDWRVPESMAELARHLRRTLGGHPAADLIDGCLTNTWSTSMRRGDDGEVFVVTGDIPAMWLRDSTAQVRPYLHLAAHDPVVADVLAGVSRRQVRYVLLDPYANAFNDGPADRHADASDRPLPGPWVWERKYEVDSLAAPLHLAYALWRATGRTDHLDARFAAAARLIVRIWRLEQDHASSPYTFHRTAGRFTGDTLDRDGRGGEVATTGMTWSGFRPSDDRCAFGYLVPANALASAGLHGLARIATEVLGDEPLAVQSRSLADGIDAGIERHARTRVDGTEILAYEVDGRGNVLVADDANLPSLLSLPLAGWCRRDDPLYLATREVVLSPANPWYYSGTSAAGVGSPHTPPKHVWPLAIAATGLTACDETQRADALATLARTTGGTGLMHESFHVDDPGRFTRQWFGWANAMFIELAMDLTGRGVAHLFPEHPRAAGPTAVRDGVG